LAAASRLPSPPGLDKCRFSFTFLLQVGAVPGFLPEEGVEMPIYEYRCEGCGKSFSLSMHIAEHDKGGIACPECRGTSVVQQYSAFCAKTSRKS